MKCSPSRFNIVVWPIFHGEFECIGATIHHATLRVDAGDILTQARPQTLDGSDSIHDVGCKAMISGVRSLSLAIPLITSGLVTGVKQDLSVGRVFKRSDFNLFSLKKAKSNLRSGGLRDYLDKRTVRDSLFPIQEI